MSKHKDWSRITPDVAIWCQTEEKDIAFRQECEERGIWWRASSEPSADSRYCLNENTVMQDAHLYLIATPYSDLLIEDKPMRSRLAEILGVEIGERFRVRDFSPEYYIDQRGRMMFDECIAGQHAIFCAINHPECIIRLPRKPRFSDDELAFLARTGARYVSKKIGGNIVDLWDGKPAELAEGRYINAIGGNLIGYVPASCLPSLSPGQCVELAEVLLEATTCTK